MGGSGIATCTGCDFVCGAYTIPNGPSDTATVYDEYENGTTSTSQGTKTTQGATTLDMTGSTYGSGYSYQGTTNGSVTKTVTTTDTRPQINVSGTWKKVNAVKVNVGGTWKSVSVTNTSSTTYTK